MIRGAWEISCVMRWEGRGGVSGGLETWRVRDVVKSEERERERRGEERESECRR